MRATLITGGLPKSVLIDGRECSICWDYQTWMRFDGIRESNIGEEEKLIGMLQLCYPRIPENIEEAVNKMLWFYRCGEEEEKEEKRQRYQRRTSKEPAFSFSQDEPYIYAAFLEEYGIDLTQTQDLHWWKFMSLFESLGEDTKMSKIMYYRKASISGLPKERRAFINEMKKLYQIRQNSEGRRLTLEERNQRWIDYVKERCGATA